MHGLKEKCPVDLTGHARFFPTVKPFLRFAVLAASNLYPPQVAIWLTFSTVLSANIYKTKNKKRSNAAAANIVIKQPLPITPKTSNGNASFLLEYQNATLMSITTKVLPLRQVEITPSRKHPQRLVVQLLFIYYCKTNDIVKHNV